jgi:hypothetical protein
VNPIARVVLAFSLSAAASASTIVVILSSIGHAVSSFQYALTVAASVYGDAVVVGLPAFLVFRFWRLHSVASYVGGAIIVAAPLMAMATMLSEEITLLLVGTFSAAVGGIVFHTVMEKSS